MTHPALIERITRSLAYMLRHQPEQFDLELDEYGCAELDDVVQALNERLGEAVEEEDVQAAITSGDRVRYEITDRRIRALYGHSIEVKPGEPSRPPALLFVGVSSADAERARRYGLRAGRRRFLHLALTPDDALETGRRSARDYVVITVNALDAWEEGINFYDRKALFLSDPIPTHFLEVGDTHSDGYGEEGSGGEGARRDDGRRGEGRRDDRHSQDRHARHHDRGSPSGPRQAHPPMREEFAAREQPRNDSIVQEDATRPRFGRDGAPPDRALQSAGHENAGHEPGGRRRRRRGGHRRDEATGPQEHAHHPDEGGHAPHHSQEDRRDIPRAPEAPRAPAGESRDRPSRSHGDHRHDFQRPPSGDRPRQFEPHREERRDDRRSPNRHADDRRAPAHAAPSASHTPTARPAERPTTMERGGFGSGIFEQPSAKPPARERAPTSPPRERERREPPREAKPENRADDSGFGAGI